MLRRRRRADARRLTAPIADLAIDYWLLYHPDLKTVARVRRVSEWIRAVFRDARPELQGRRSPVPTRPNALATGHTREERMYLDPRLWALTRGVRGRIAATVVVGLAAVAAGIARLALLGWLLARVLAGESLASLPPPSR